MPKSDRCPLCNHAGEACMFHSAGNPAMLVRSFERSLAKKGSLALADLLTATVSRIDEAIPEAARDLLSQLDAKPVYARYAKILRKAELTSNDLRSLAGAALALAIIADEMEDPVGGEDEDESEAELEDENEPGAKRDPMGSFWR